VWAYDVPRFSTPLAVVGEKIYTSGALEVYRIRKTSDQPPASRDRDSGKK
jgi:hypothetical protein